MSSAKMAAILSQPQCVNSFGAGAGIAEEKYANAILGDAVVQS